MVVERADSCVPISFVDASSDLSFIDGDGKEENTRVRARVRTVTRLMGLGPVELGNGWWWCQCTIKSKESSTEKSGNDTEKSVVMHCQSALKLYHRDPSDSWPIHSEKRIDVTVSGERYVAVRFVGFGTDPRFVWIYPRDQYLAGFKSSSMHPQITTPR